MTDLPDCRRFLDGRVTLYPGDCLAILDRLPENSVDVIICDPPYHFDTIVERFGKEGAAPAKFGTDGVFSRASSGFMGKDWDGGDIAFRPDTWAKALRVLKPGGHLAAFSAPKCVHKMAFGIEAAGFEVRDRIINLIDPDERVIAFLDSLSAAQSDALFRMLDQFGPLGEAFWTFGSGFPKNHDVSKAIDKIFGAERPIVGPNKFSHLNGKANVNVFGAASRPDETASASSEAKTWEGWGTALKPAYEPIVIARKPLAESSIARQALKTGTGAINIDAARVRYADEADMRAETRGVHASRKDYAGLSEDGGAFSGLPSGRTITPPNSSGRFPANLTHDGSDAVLAGFPGDARSAGVAARPDSVGTGDGVTYQPTKPQGTIYADAAGSAARFFYTAKADAHDRIGSGHPTVKPLDLMQWLCRMLTPPGGTILDIFAGTGTTGEAAFREGFDAILIERDPDYQADIARRMENALSGPVARRHAATRAKAARKAADGLAPAPNPVGSTVDMFADGGL
ncbi:DNA methyltransferase [Mesorhizobium sp. CAU 1732]|uniref:DNA methyltransferase n=1 Tax=Mesorhizobium sp. CAU 1732 TaxID=3140358 RepID=UPI0032602C1F